MRILNLILILVLITFTSACSQAKDNPKKADEQLSLAFDDAHEASIYALYNQFILTNSVFKAAYNEANQKTKTNDALLGFAGKQINVIKTAYEALGKNFTEDLDAMVSNKKSMLTIQAVDGICVNNKFIAKYSKVTDFSKLPNYVKEYSEEALKLQPKIEQILKKEGQSPLGGSICNTLQ